MNDKITIDKYEYDSLLFNKYQLQNIENIILKNSEYIKEHYISEDSNKSRIYSIRKIINKDKIIENIFDKFALIAEFDK